MAGTILRVAQAMIDRDIRPASLQSVVYLTVGEPVNGVTVLSVPDANAVLGVAANRTTDLINLSQPDSVLSARFVPLSAFQEILRSGLTTAR